MTFKNICKLGSKLVAWLRVGHLDRIRNAGLVMRAQCFYSYQLALWPQLQQQESNLVTTTLTHAARFACLMAGVHNSRPCGGPGDKNVYSCPCHFQDAHRSFFLRKQKCVSERSRRRWGSRVTAELWFLSTERVHVTFLASRIWTWCLDLWKACAHSPHFSRRLFVALLCYTG
jgi:hypothetical protein